MSKSNLEILFTEAASRGFLKPTLRVEGLRFKLAPATGRNPGAVYITRASDSEYLGKIQNDCIYLLQQHANVERNQQIRAVMNNPKEEAVKWGHQSGECSICGRRLDNAISVYNGIGPICAEKLGFPLATPPAPEDSFNGLSATNLL